ncbi:MAG: glycosyl transferase [Oscillospiraceae bacterium]|nr:glycosyl transferase [Oscillospiraceae bacterium]
MIPKIIHYCWFGRGEVPKLMKKCLKSWDKFCPGWEIRLWNEDNFDVNSTLWTKQAYEAKKYAFVADYVRIWVLEKCGGVYLDTDQELVKPLEPFLMHEAFMGFLDSKNISAGVLGAVAHHPVMEKLLSYYDERPFYSETGMDIKPNTNWMTDVLVELGLKMDDSFQQLPGVAVYPQTYFCPTSCVSIEDKTSADTVALHHWAMTWRTEKAKKDFARAKWHSTPLYRGWEQVKILPQRVIRKLFGDEAMEKLKRFLGKQ